LSKILAVTEFYNEATNIPGLVESVSKQTTRPDAWLIINDGSTDASVAIFTEMLEKHNFSYILHEMPPKPTPDANMKGVAFQSIDVLNPDEQAKYKYDFVAKLDADSRLPVYYIEICLNIMNWFPEIGVMAGRIIGESGGAIPMGTGKIVRWNIIQATSRNYWDLDPDTLWNIKSVMHGYRLLIVEDLLLEVTRPTQISGPRGIYDYGRRMYYIGTHPLLVLNEAISLFFKRGSPIQFLRGYLHEKAIAEWKCEDPDVQYFYGLKNRLLYKLNLLPKMERTLITKVGIAHGSEDVLAPQTLQSIKETLKQKLQ
jgi:glycosyltransferase involved in cell wall biosynthesis